jgi:ketosteroid isomerase-like protein
MKHGLLPLAAVFLFVGAARADDAKAAIQAQYNKRSAAALKKDVAASLAINAPDFVTLDLEGKKRTQAQLKPQLTQIFATIKSYSITTKITKCTLSGDKATVQTLDSVTIMGKNVLTAEATSEDTWVKKGSQWLRTQNKLLTNKRTSTPPKQ